MFEDSLNRTRWRLEDGAGASVGVVAVDHEECTMRIAYPGGATRDLRLTVDDVKGIRDLLIDAQVEIGRHQAARRRILLVAEDLQRGVYDLVTSQLTGALTTSTPAEDERR